MVCVFTSLILAMHCPLNRQDTKGYSVYKSRLYWGNLIFVGGAIPAFLMLNGIGPNESSSQAGAVGLFVIGILLPLIGVGSILSITAVIKLTNIQKLQKAHLNNMAGIISLSIGWLILLLVVNVVGWLTFGYISISQCVSC